MFDDNNDNLPWFSGDGEYSFPGSDHPGVIEIPFLRDTALKMFGRFLAHQSGLDIEHYNFDNDVSEQQKFLSIEETDAIVRSHAAADNGEMMAVGGNSRAEAVQKINELMSALMGRIMSNVIAEGAKRDLIDVAFDDGADCFAFHVNANGHKLIQENKALFEGENDAD